MLVLKSPITLDAAALSSPNLCDRFDDDDLRNIGIECWEGYTRDEASRAVWLKRNEAGMDLALQIQKDKESPWPGCSNVAFPLVTIAAMQFHARAYPAIVGGSQIVKCAVFGEDKDGQKAAHADRVATHMSWQLLFEDKCWEEQEDKAILNLSIVGTNFKKSYYSAAVKHNVSELVLAKDLVLNYWAKSIEDCPRKTHRIPLFRNEVYEKVMRGTFCDCLDEPWYQGAPASRTTVTQTSQDNRQGVTPPQPDDSTSLLFLEQHCNLDLDGDGYAEPYIITFESTSKCVCRIVTRFDREEDIERVASGKRKGQIIRITAMEYFTKKTFIPSPDGGIYDIGFGVFLGPLNEAVNSLVNMLLDAGTMQTTGGGFLGRGAKIRGGVYTIAPFEWKRVDSTGDDLRKSIFPLPVNAPSDVLFQLLSLLINYTSRVAGTTDITVGENPGQNTPAQTTQTMVEMGQKIYTAIFKRIWRSSKEEFSKLFKLNGIFLPLDVPQVGGATRQDYQGSSDQISPVADPNITSDSMKLQLAGTMKAAAASTPGYNHDEVERRFLKALHVDAIDAVFPGTEGQPPAKDPKLVIEETKIQGRLQELQIEMQARQQEFAISLMEERKLNNAKIIELMAKADEASANAQSEQAYAQVAMVNAQITSLKSTNERINTRIEHLLRAAEIESRHEIELKKLAQPAKKAAE
jgi:chaperonin GroES